MVFDTYFARQREKEAKLKKLKEDLKNASDEMEIELLEDAIFDLEHGIMSERELKNDI